MGSVTVHHVKLRIVKCTLCDKEVHPVETAKIIHVRSGSILPFHDACFALAMQRANWEMVLVGDGVDA